MKCRFLLAMALCFLLGVGKTMAQSSKAELAGVWQMCFYMSSDPNLPGELKPSNSFKILSEDGKFTNMTVVPNTGAIIIGSGTYKQTAPNAYTEHVEKNLHLPQLVGVDNVLEFEMRPSSCITTPAEVVTCPIAAINASVSGIESKCCCIFSS